ncbi:MAG: molybdopterin-guanine dinucleotide biosynthesis protein MobB [Candidatus Cloacimonetes bacterium]|nr:molybdopterin-guanine dinucleotide biosynthesis protein MobB [Candidatus Cloacimonadota bacterium]
MKAIGIIGYHHTGKTTLAAALITALAQKGFQVASIKDIHNEDYCADKKGSNSWTHARAGASQVFARGLQDAALILNSPPDLPRMLSLVSAEWLIIEGLKDAAVPKIVCANDTSQADELVDDTAIALCGRISAQTGNYKGLPVFALEQQLPELIELSLDKAFEILPHSDPDCCSACGKSCYQMAGDIVQGRSQRSDCVLDHQNSLDLAIGGQPLTIVPFVQNLLRDIILAFAANLKGIDPSQDIDIKIRR